MKIKIVVGLVIFAMLLSGCSQKAINNNNIEGNVQVSNSNQSNTLKPNSIDCEKESLNAQYPLVAKAECYKNLAIKDDNLTICEKMPEKKDFPNELRRDDVFQTSWEKSSCYFEIAVNKRDTAFCEQIPLGTLSAAYYKENCYSEIAKLEKDSTICEKITEFEYIKTNCLAFSK